MARHLLLVLRVLGGPEDGTDGSGHQQPDEDVDPQDGEQVAGPLGGGPLPRQLEALAFFQLCL